MAPSRGTAPGTPARWLIAAWQSAAEGGGPACVLMPRDGVLVMAWINQPLGQLLGRDVGELAGRPLRELAESDLDLEATGSAPSPVLTALLPADGPGPGGGSTVICWARLAHQIARSGGGSGVGSLRRVDGSDNQVRVTVTPVSANSRGCEVLVGTAAGTPSGKGAGSGRGPVPTQGRTPGAADGAGEDRPTVTFRGATVPPAGVVGELPGTERSACWLVEIEPVNDAVAEAEAAVTVAEHRFTALAGCAPIGIFASDAGLRLGYVNDFFVSLTGVPAHSLLGNGWLDVIDREDLPAVYTAVQTVLGGTAVELAIRLSARQGVQRWVHVRLAPTTTPARAAGFIGTAEDVTERRSWEEHLTYQATHDPLTGLVNRRRLIEVLTDLLSGRRGRDRDFAVLFLDLDGFKEVNDTLGHDAGDRALIEVARRMQRVARESDLLARVAGDEFVVVLRNIVSESEAEAAARRHLNALGEPVRIGSTDVRLSASIGVALPAGFDTPDSLLRAADRVMYEAKAAGHGLYRLAPVGPARDGR